VERDEVDGSKFASITSVSYMLLIVTKALWRNSRTSQTDGHMDIISLTMATLATHRSQKLDGIKYT